MNVRTGSCNDGYYLVEVCVCITVVVAVRYMKTSSSLLSTLYIVPVPAKHGDMGMGMREKGM